MTIIGIDLGTTFSAVSTVYDGTPVLLPNGHDRIVPSVVDVSLVEIANGVIDVRASHGDTHLGGDDFDERLAQYLLKQFEEENGIDLSHNPQALARIRRAAEQAKIDLSSNMFTWVREEYLA